MQIETSIARELGKAAGMFGPSASDVRDNALQAKREITARRGTRQAVDAYRRGELPAAKARSVVDTFTGLMPEDTVRTAKGTNYPGLSAAQGVNLTAAKKIGEEEFKRRAAAQRKQPVNMTTVLK